MVFTPGRVYLCNRTCPTCAHPIAFSLTLPVLFHVRRMGLAVPLPVIPVCFSPSALSITSVLHVLRIIEKLLTVPSALALFRKLGFQAVRLFLHLPTRMDGDPGIRPYSAAL